MKLKFIVIVLVVLALFLIPVLIGGYRKRDERRDNSFKRKIERLTDGWFDSFKVSMADIDQTGSSHSSCWVNRHRQIEIQAQCGSVTRFKPQKRRFSKVSVSLKEGEPCTVRFVPDKSQSGGIRPMATSKVLVRGGQDALEIVLLDQGASLMIEPCSDGGTRTLVLQ